MIQVTKIDDKSDGFTVEFTVSNQYKQTFPARPAGLDQNTYARDSVRGIVGAAVVEKVEGAVVSLDPVVPPKPEPTIELVAPAPVEIPPAPPAEPGIISRIIGGILGDPPADTTIVP